MAIALGCLLCGLSLAARAPELAPAAVTNLGTMVVSPTRTQGPTLGPVATTVRRSSLQFQMGFPAPRSTPPASPAGAGRSPAKPPPPPAPKPVTRTPPKLLHRVPPTYPRIALAEAKRGSVTVSFTITPVGDTKAVHVLSAHPAGVFDEAAVEAVRQWRFAPATADGRPVATTVKQTIVFNPPLREKAAPAPQPVPARAQPASAKPPAKTAAKEKLQLVHVAQPEYPPSAYRQRLGGSVTLRFTVGTDGRPRDIHIVEAKPRGIFNRAAKQAVRKWRFKPPASPTQVTQTIRFTPPG